MEHILEMNKRAKWNLNAEEIENGNILMWEDKSLGDCRHLDDLEKPLDQALAELADGVVIIFQVKSLFCNQKILLQDHITRFQNQNKEKK